MNGTTIGPKYYNTNDTLWDTFTIEVSEQVYVVEI